MLPKRGILRRHGAKTAKRTPVVSRDDEEGRFTAPGQIPSTDSGLDVSRVLRRLTIVATLLNIPASQLELGDEIISGDDNSYSRTVIAVWPADQFGTVKDWGTTATVTVRESPWGDYQLSFPNDQQVTINRGAPYPPPLGFGADAIDGT